MIINDDKFGIRRVTVVDVVALAELAASTFVHTFGHLYCREDLDEYLATSQTPAVYERLIKDPEVAGWFAVAVDGTPVAYVLAGSCKLPVADLEPSAGEIRSLYVRADHQNHQLGTRLLGEALDWLALHDRAPLYVGVWSENFGAQRLYGRYGFAKIGEYEFPVGRQRDREFILRRSVT
jgi:diamine N-acetyltransferase